MKNKLDQNTLKQKKQQITQCKIITNKDNQIISNIVQGMNLKKLKHKNSSK